MDDAFSVPTDQDFIESLGVAPEKEVGEDCVWGVRVNPSGSDLLFLTYDVPGRSVRIRWGSSSEFIVDIFREGAKSLEVKTEKGRTLIAADFGSGLFHGRVEVQVYPEFRISDRMLIT